MPDPGKAIMIGNLFLLATSANAIEVHGLTVNHMPFQGILESTDDEFISLSGKAYGNSRISIPIAEIEEFDLSGPEIPDAEITELLRHPPVLHLWNGKIQDSLVHYVENLAGKEEWVNAYHCACVLENAISRPDLLDRILLVKAWSLFEMGLYKKSQEIIGTQETARDNTHATTRYCWLRAKLARIDGDLEMATYWSLLPVLRIPGDTSELAIQLYGECESWQREHGYQWQP